MRRRPAARPLRRSTGRGRVRPLPSTPPRCRRQQEWKGMDRPPFRRRAGGFDTAGTGSPSSRRRSGGRHSWNGLPLLPKASGGNSTRRERAPPLPEGGREPYRRNAPVAAGSGVGYRGGGGRAPSLYCGLGHPKCPAPPAARPAPPPKPARGRATGAHAGPLREGAAERSEAGGVLRAGRGEGFTRRHEDTNRWGAVGEGLREGWNPFKIDEINIEILTKNICRIW